MTQSILKKILISTLLILISEQCLKAQTNRQDSIVFSKDSIIYKEGIYYSKDSRQFTNHDLFKQLKTLKDDSINYYLKKHDKRLKTSNELAFAGGFVIGITLANDDFEEGEKAAFVVGGIGICVISVIHGRSRFKFVRKAVKRYNYLIAELPDKP